jgi:hypothetical protein
MTGAALTRLRSRWTLLVVAAIVGALLSMVFGEHHARLAASYVGGLVLASLALEFGALNIRLAAKYAPNLTMAVALFSYLLTAVFLALVLAGASPRVISGIGVAAGLFVSMTIWLGALLCASWVRDEHAVKPVNIRAQDETISSSRAGRR